MLTLLRYNNRKIYNKQIAGYVSSDEVVEYLKSGLLVKVLNANTHTDITHVALVGMGASQMRQGNVEGGRLLIRYADAYRPSFSSTGGV